MKTRFKQYWEHSKSVLTTEAGFITVFADSQAIKAIDFGDYQHKENPNDISELGTSQLSEYIEGKRQQFNLPLAADGTEFQQLVWQQLQTVEYGQISTYLTIAKKVGNPLASRAIGMANGKNPISIVVPCHRIIGSNGKLTGYAGGLARKTFLLDLEARYA